MSNQEEDWDALRCLAALNALVNQDSQNKELQIPFRFDQIAHKVES